MPAQTGRTTIVLYYAAWAATCAAAAGLAITVVHTLFFTYRPTPADLTHTLWTDALTALAIALGQGAVALGTGAALAALGRTLRFTFLLGLLVGLFDFGMFFLQMVVPATELGWAADLAILAVATAAITAAGARAGAEGP
ncbi:MAG TPA: hypothetical protein VNI61_08925 [Gemmatimonadales bacterium]|nr:hypothetical protein [Gemmatimonadales bacterium]